MWRWTVLVCVILIQKHTSSQPITDDSTNDRITRQLDFEKCCPCFDRSSDRDAGSDEPVAAASEGVFPRPRDVDDCPCRNSPPDSQGASSVFFPTAMRAAGSFLRPGEKKEDLKPLFNPEVDLASSVLQTLREVTDEEYQDALARDAARSTAKAVEDLFIGDATPQESANIVTIVVNPGLTDDDDAVPEASHTQQSRCIHPLQSPLGKLRKSYKPNLFEYKPRLAKPKSGVLHNAFDSGMGASNVHEQIVLPNEDSKRLSSDFSPLRILNNINEENALSNDDTNTSFNIKVPEVKSITEKKNIFDVNRSSLLDSIRNKIDNALSRTPKRLRDLLPDRTRNFGSDLNPAMSAINEQAAKRHSYFKTNPVHDSFKQNHGPLSISNVLNLKDVEIIPVEDLVKKADAVEMSQRNQMPQFIMDHADRSSVENGEKLIRYEEFSVKSKNNLFEDNYSDTDGSSSSISTQTPKNEQIDDDCNEDTSKYSMSVKQYDSNPEPNFNELRASIEQLTNNVETANSAINYDDCSDQDSIIDASNNFNKIVKQPETNVEGYITSSEDKTRTNDESCEGKEQGILNIDDSTQHNDDKMKFKLLDPSLVDQTISSIKNNIAKKLEDLKNIKKGNINKAVLNREISSEQNDEESTVAKNENADCQDDASIDSTNINEVIEQQFPNQRDDVKLAEDQKRTNGESCDEEPQDISILNENTENNESKVTKPKLPNLHSEDKTESDTKDNIEQINREQETNQKSNYPIFKDSNREHDESCDDEEQGKPIFKDDKENKSKLKLLDSSFVERTISNIKDNIAKKLGDLKNIRNSNKNKDVLNREILSEQNDKDSTTARNENEDCQDDASIQFTTLLPYTQYVNSEEFTTSDPDLLHKLQDNTSHEVDSSINTEDVITLKPDTTHENAKVASECTDKDVSLQDLQKLSDSMLQQEEQERETLNSNEGVDLINDESSTSKSTDAVWTDLENSANTLIAVTEEPATSNNLRDNNNEKSVCNSNLVSPKPLLTDLMDTNVDASEVIVSSVPQSNNILNSKPILEPTRNVLKNQLAGVSDLLKLPSSEPLPVIEDIKLKLNDLFDKNDKNLEQISASETNTMSNLQDTVGAAMIPAASTSSFQSRVPSSGLLDGMNLKRLELKPHLRIFPDLPKLDLQSYKTKLPLPKDLNLKPIQLHSSLGNTQSLLPTTSSTGQKSKHLNVNKYSYQSNDNPSSIFNKQWNLKPKVSDAGNRLSDSPLGATNNIFFRKPQESLEAKFRQAANKNNNLLRNPIKSSSSLFDSLSRNHEDISDKLKGLQMDLNDRLETMRNDLIDRSKLLTSGSRNSKNNLSNIRKQKKGKQPLKLTWQAPSSSQKMSSPRKPAEQKPVKITPPSKANRQNLFRMPGAASVPVPNTIKVPELKTTSEKSNPITLNQGSIIPKWNRDVPETKERPEVSGRQLSKLQGSLLRKPFNTRKDSKIVVSFSTTPRPVIIDNIQNSSPYVHSNNLEESRGQFRPRMTNGDIYGSPSGLQKSMATAPDSDHLTKQKSFKEGFENDITSRKAAVGKDDKSNSLEVKSFATNHALQPKFKASESPLFKKVKEAVATRLSKVNSPKTLKESPSRNQEKVDTAAREPKADMARSASENKQTVDNLTLKENVSYKCKMVCTKE